MNDRHPKTPEERFSYPALHLAPPSEDVDTLDFKPTTGVRPMIVAPTLTILSHPDAELVGAQAVLTFQRSCATVCRLEPQFSLAGRIDREPLGDPHVSRRAISLVRFGDALEIRPPEGGLSCHVDGELLIAPLSIKFDALQRGVVVRLGRHVALLLHANPAVDLGTKHPLLVGNSHLMTDLRDRIAKVARHAVPVLLQGESGVGKELIAQALHDASPWAKGPFIAVNTGAIQASLASSELFGHVKGSFTGATADHDGFFARADGGTIFLDEIGELGPDVQALLLRVLETGEVQRVGDRRVRRVQVRVVAATDRQDLEARLRVPLVQRLSGYRLQVPALRERFEDLGLLLYHFLKLEFGRMRQRFPPTLLVRPDEPIVPPEVFQQLVRHPFAGNVRELLNVARRLAIDGLDRSTSDIVASVAAALSPATPAGLPVAAAGSGRPGKAPSEISDDLLLAVLRRNRWQMAAAARELGIARSSMYLLVDQCPQVRKAHQVPPVELDQALADCGQDIDRTAARLEVSPKALRAWLKRSQDEAAPED